MTVENAVALAALALVGTILTVVVKPLFRLLKDNTNALKALVESNNKIAIATNRGADEAKQRNGHLAELIISSASSTQTVKEQHVHGGQIVDTQVIEGETK